MKWAPKLLCAVALLSCGDDDAAIDASLPDAAPDGTTMCTARTPAERPDPGLCAALATDYARCEDDLWGPCVSDFGTYARIQPSISSIARVGAFEAIAPLLFDYSADATAETFLEARGIYQEDEGLDSRVVRRFDPRADAPDGTDCTLDGVPAMFPEFCVGPALLQPLLLDAFAAGSAGDRPRVQAAKIEAGLLWFFYASVAKESLTCTTAAKDCDSAYAYYTGGAEARGGVGLGGRVQDVDAYAHDRVWDGILALRCWRDLDDSDVAEDLALRERARNQLDRAVTDGLAAVLVERLGRIDGAPAEAAAAHWAFSRVLGQALDRPLTQRDAEAAATVRLAFEAETPDGSAIATVVDALRSTFDCP